MDAQIVRVLPDGSGMLVKPLNGAAQVFVRARTVGDTVSNAVLGYLVEIDILDPAEQDFLPAEALKCRIVGPPTQASADLPIAERELQIFTDSGLRRNVKRKKWQARSLRLFRRSREVKTRVG